MDEKSLIFGVSYAVDDLIMALFKQRIDLNVDDDYYVNISPPPIADLDKEFEGSVVSGIFVDLTEELVKAILVWLNTPNKELEDSSMKISIGGNLLNITAKDMEVLLNVMNECAKLKREKTDAMT